MGIPGPPELFLIVLVVLIIFGAGKLPEVGKALGKGIREFKSAREGNLDDEKEKPPETKTDDV